jgi:hypothetical protein
MEVRYQLLLALIVILTVTFFLTDESLIDFALEKNEISVYKILWGYFSIQSSAVTATVSLEMYIRKTIQFFNSFAQDELVNDNRVAKSKSQTLLLSNRPF